MQNEKKEKLSENGGEIAKILLVEDDSFLRDICEKKLKKEGFNVETAVDGREAVEKAGEFKPELILLDIILPVMDGFEVLKRIRSHNDESVKKTPVIMLTNLGQEEDSKKALALGANDYLVKAYFTTEDIIQKIKKRLGL
ncbi:MAG: response regulator [bacterium]